MTTDDRILEILINILAEKKQLGEKHIHYRNTIKEAVKKVNEEEGAEGAEGATEFKTVPEGVLRLIFKPQLSAELLALLAKVLANNPEAVKALVKLLTESPSLSPVAKTLVKILSKSTSAGADATLRSALDKAPGGLYNELSKTIGDTSRFNPKPSPGSAPRPRPKGFDT